MTDSMKYTLFADDYSAKPVAGKTYAKSGRFLAGFRQTGAFPNG